MIGWFSQRPWIAALVVALLVWSLPVERMVREGSALMQATMNVTVCLSVATRTAG